MERVRLLLRVKNYPASTSASLVTHGDNMERARVRGVPGLF